MKTLLFLMLLSVSSIAFAQEAEEESEALRAMRLSCEKQKVGLGCFNYANMLARGEKSEEAEKYFEKGCALKHEASCQKEKWDLPARVKVVEQVPEAVAATPAPASVDESAEAVEEPAEAVDLGLETEPDINQ